MENINGFIKDLDWHKPDVVTQRAMQELLNVSNDEAILLANQSNDLCSKPCWHNAAIVLKEIGYPRNKLTLPYLMEWFQDVNWPGVETIIELLKDIDKDILIPHIKNGMERALQDNDVGWAFGFFMLLDELNLTNNYFEEDDLINKMRKLQQSWL